MTQLHRAVWAGDLALVQSLIDKGTTLRSTTHDGKTASHYACLKNFQNLDILRLLLESGDREILMWETTTARHHCTAPQRPTTVPKYTY